jgi:hypothetical protein
MGSKRRPDTRSGSATLVQRCPIVRPARRKLYLQVDSIATLAETLVWLGGFLLHPQRVHLHQRLPSLLCTPAFFYKETAAVSRIRIRIRIRMFLGLLDPDPLVRGSVADPDPNPDPHVVEPPGSGSINQRYGSGSFYHQSKLVRKTF